MRAVTIKIEGLTPYSSSRYLTEKKAKNETHDDFERRIWREKAHCDDDGNVFVPGVGFKLAVDEAAKLVKEKIPGKAPQTYGTIFPSACSAVTDMHLGIKKGSLKAISIPCHANGNRTSGSRVIRYFPLIPEWGGDVEFRIFNDAIPEEVFERYFAEAGLLAGIGRGRPSKGCPAGNGRFRPLSFDWKDLG